jgi:hypothetical protein
VARWLKAQPDPAPQHLGVRYTATVHPFYRGEISSPISDELDYVAFYIKQTQSGYPAPEILGYFEQQGALHRVILDGVDYAQIYRGPAMIPVDPEPAQKLPVAYRPYTIYAPIGESLVVDLLWPADDLTVSNDRPITLTLTSAGQAWTWAASAPIINQAPDVIVSTHRFDLPPDMARRTIELRLGEQILGHLKARRMTVPQDFSPLAAVFNNQLALVGIKQTPTPEGLAVDLAWQGWSNIPNDYTVFIQLLDSRGERVTGVDVAHEPGFTHLDRREIMVTHDTVPLPADVNPGEYTMLIGLYYFAGDQVINVGSARLDEPVILP